MELFDNDKVISKLCSQHPLLNQTHVFDDKLASDYQYNEIENLEEELGTFYGKIEDGYRLQVGRSFEEWQKEYLEPEQRIADDFIQIFAWVGRITIDNDFFVKLDNYIFTIAQVIEDRFKKESLFDTQLGIDNIKFHSRLRADVILNYCFKELKAEEQIDVYRELIIAYHNLKARKLKASFFNELYDYVLTYLEEKKDFYKDMIKYNQLSKDKQIKVSDFYKIDVEIKKTRSKDFKGFDFLNLWIPEDEELVEASFHGVMKGLCDLNLEEPLFLLKDGRYSLNKPNQGHNSFFAGFLIVCTEKGWFDGIEFNKFSRTEKIQLLRTRFQIADDNKLAVLDNRFYFAVGEKSKKPFLDIPKRK